MLFRREKAATEKVTPPLLLSIINYGVCGRPQTDGGEGEESLVRVYVCRLCSHALIIIRRERGCRQADSLSSSECVIHSLGQQPGRRRERSPLTEIFRALGGRGQGAQRTGRVGQQWVEPRGTAGGGGGQGGRSVWWGGGCISAALPLCDASHIQTHRSVGFL